MGELRHALFWRPKYRQRVLKCIFKKQNAVTWIGCKWLRIQSSGGYYEYSNSILSCMAEKLSASEEGLCFMGIN
jgi:hypothetical protein